MQQLNILSLFIAQYITLPYVGLLSSSLRKLIKCWFFVTSQLSCQIHIHGSLLPRSQSTYNVETMHIFNVKCIVPP